MMLIPRHTADLYDEIEEQGQVVSPGLRNYGGKPLFAGPIRTVKCHEDNSKVKELVATPGEGHVLVVDGGGSMRCALLGDMLAGQAVENGWAGIVIYGCIRDSHIMATLDLGVKALETNPRKSVKRGIGDVDVSVNFHGVTFCPGDHLYADQDGVIVVPK